MTNTITVGRRLIPLHHIALVEPFDPASATKMQTERVFQARVVLIDRESVLAEEAVPAFAGKHGLRMIEGEGVAVNPAIRFKVETFAPDEGFTPTKPYRSRLMWRDLDGVMQSKLLLSAPETLLAIAVKGESEKAAPSESGEGGKSRTASNAGRRKSRRRVPAAAPA
jgi:hypothetical protein